MKKILITLFCAMLLVSLVSAGRADDQDTTDQVSYLERELAGANPGSENYTAGQKEQIAEQIRMYKNRQAAQEESQQIELEKRIKRLEDDKELN